MKTAGIGVSKARPGKAMDREGWTSAVTVGWGLWRAVIQLVIWVAGLDLNGFKVTDEIVLRGTNES